MPWIIAILLTVGLIGLTCLFIINARALERDVNQRRDAFRASLEHHANAVVDDFLRANPADGVRASPGAANK